GSSSSKPVGAVASGARSVPVRCSDWLIDSCCLQGLTSSGRPRPTAPSVSERPMHHVEGWTPLRVEYYLRIHKLQEHMAIGIADCGLRIADSKTPSSNPQSAMDNPHYQ